jgi:hypothetical protein
MRQQLVRVPSDKYKLKKCRICSSPELYTFLKLGTMPIPNGFIFKKDLTQKEFFFPLNVCVCKNCFLVSLTHVIPPEIMFKNYLYIPSTSNTVLNHFQEFSKSVYKEYNLSKNDLVVDIGSNDGTLLSWFKKLNVEALGIDPAENIVKDANRRGIKTICSFFTKNKALELAKSFGKAKIICGTNVIAHINNIHDVFEGVSAWLNDEGVFIMEAPYLIDLIEKNEFDTIYHEHLSYFAINPLKKLFELHDLKIINVQKFPIHGGSLRIFVAKKNSHYKSNDIVEKFILEETAKGLCDLKTYSEFSERVSRVKSNLVNFIKKVRKNGKTVAGYGAAAKGNVMLNSSKLDSRLIDFIVDSIKYKQGKYTPGTHIPIFSEDKLLKKMPDYTIILAWNFAHEIVAKNQDYLAKGGRFIVPVPNLQIL